MYGDLLTLKHKPGAVVYEHCVMRIQQQCEYHGLSECPSGYMSEQCDKYKPKLVLLEDDVQELLVVDLFAADRRL